MRLPDELIAKYLLLAADLPPDEVAAAEAGLSDGSLHPNEQKRRMARGVVELYHGPDAAGDAEHRFDLVHKQREVPQDAAEMEVLDSVADDGRVWLPRLLVAVGFAASNGDARRLISGGGVRLDGEQVRDPSAEFALAELRGRVLQAGSHRFVRLA
jgi:tyrosyl-tRNA synthetase